MKILGVITLVSPHGEYGGPLRVAVNQLRALQERGHSVVLAGAHRGYPDRPPEQIEGVPTRLFPARTIVPGTGFAGLGAPGLLAAMRAHAQEFDVVHVHAARDLVTLPAARIAQRRGVRTVLQTHGMIDESSNPLSRPLDALLTLPTLRGAHRVTYLTDHERRSLESVGADPTKLTELANGVPAAEVATDPGRPSDVLYLARLASRKQPLLFAQAAREIADEFPEARFALVGPDEGEAGPLEQELASHPDGRVTWEGPLPPEMTLRRMASATAYVLPSVHEPYPMSVLEAMSVGLPVVVTDTCGLARFITEHDAGIVIEPTLEALASALRSLLSDPAAAAARGRRGREAVLTERSMTVIATRLEQLYRD